MLVHMHIESEKDNLVESRQKSGRQKWLSCTVVGISSAASAVRTIRRTMIRFSVELLARRTWFGRTVQTLLRSQQACNVMQASARTCGRRAADSMIENVG